jgi:peptidoglycan/xylan/chitin deacetylase (PgdA/CDA1 family)
VSLDTVVLGMASLLPPLRRPGGVRVLCYHTVMPRAEDTEDRFAVTSDTLEAHLSLIRATGHTLTSITDLERTSGEAVLLTFDDNLISHLNVSVPVLRSAGATATFYLCPGDLGAAGQLRVDHVRTLLGAGMTVGAHGKHHRLVVKMGPAEFTREVAVCRDFLQSFGMPLTWAYPGGHIGSYRQHHEQILRDYGFATRFVTLEGVCRPSPRRVQPRYVIRRQSSIRYLRAAVGGGLQLVALAKRLRAIATLDTKA